MWGYRFEAGQRLALAYRSGTTSIQLGAWVRCDFDDGTSGIMTVAPVAPAVTLTQYEASGSMTSKGGYVTGGGIYSPSILTPTAIQRGMIAATLYFTSASPAAGFVSLFSVGGPLLCRGYISNEQGFIPVGMFEQFGPGGGRGWIRTITTANPAAGAEVPAIVVSDGTIIKPLSYNVLLIQGITQTPYPNLYITDGGLDVSIIPIGAALAASTQVSLTWEVGLTDTRDNVNGGSMATALGDHILYAGSTVQTVTRGIGANTNYGAASMVVEEWVIVN